MTLSETRKAIRELPDDKIWVSQFPIADLKELEAAYEKLEKLAKEVVRDFNDSPDYWSESCDRLGAFLVSREDPDSAEARATPSGKGLSEADCHKKESKERSEAGS